MYKSMKCEEFKRLQWLRKESPVLKPEKEKAWDSFSCITPDVFSRRANGKYTMTYTGQGNFGDTWGIGLAESTDLINWRKLESNPIIADNQRNTIKGIDGAAILSYDNQHYLFFEATADGKSGINKIIKKTLPGFITMMLIKIKRRIKDSSGNSLANEHAKNRKIWFLNSTKIEEWHLNDAKVILGSSTYSWDSAGAFSPRVFEFNKKFYLFYGGTNGLKSNTGLAVSTDLKNWKKMTELPILKHGVSGSWEQNHALIVDVIRLEDGYVGFYEGENSRNRYSIGIAFSEDLIKWDKFEGNPILDPGKLGSFDEKMVCSPHVVQANGKYFLFYSGHNRYLQGCCGLAMGE